VKVDGVHTRSIWLEPDGRSVGIVDQLALPHEFRVATLRTLDDAVAAIAGMQVRGAPLIGATAAYGMALAARADAAMATLENAAARLSATRPTAVNLDWAVQRVLRVLTARPRGERVAAAYRIAADICNEDVEINRRIGVHGVKLLQATAARNPHRAVQVLTHCNAGWLATVDWGTATAPIYQAHQRGVPVHVWVDETRPRLQGALTAWELAQEGVPHTIIADGASGQLLREQRVDVVLTGTERVSACGDVANKVGTYLTALAARDNGVPFYVAAPSPSIDWQLDDGSRTPIERRDPRELSTVRGRDACGQPAAVNVYPNGSAVLNIAFDITPARLVSRLITERGIAAARGDRLAQLFGREPRARDA
jgi:methylthioribose-1-phosphate isomerase